MCHVDDHLPITCVTLRKYYCERGKFDSHKCNYVSSLLLIAQCWRGDLLLSTFIRQHNNVSNSTHTHTHIQTYLYSIQTVSCWYICLCLISSSNSDAFRKSSIFHLCRNSKPFRKWQLWKNRKKETKNKKQSIYFIYSNNWFSPSFFLSVLIS